MLIGNPHGRGLIVHMEREERVGEDIASCSAADGKLGEQISPAGDGKRPKLYASSITSRGEVSVAERKVE